MFKRILVEDWASVLQIGSFLILFTVFLVSAVRAIRLRPEERERLAALPLDPSEPDC